jgi:mannose-6-phosphate isomerase-like protein (cupin superfamily)
MKTFYYLLFCCVVSSLRSQEIQSLTVLTPEQPYENVHLKKLHTDSLSTSFVIWIREEVRPHRHAFHSESIFVLEGTAKLVIGANTYRIKAGDFFNIPENTVHAVEVTSTLPLKIISIQAPEFKGEDRVNEP